MAKKEIKQTIDSVSNIQQLIAKLTAMRIRGEIYNNEQVYCRGMCNISVYLTKARSIKSS